MDRNQLNTTTRIDILPDYAAAKRKTQNVNLTGSTVGATTYPPLGGDDFQQLLDSVYDGALITDTSGNILDANTRACRFLLYDKSDIMGSNIVGMLYGSDMTLIDEVRNSLEDDKFLLIQAACVCSDGSMFPAEISVNRLSLAGYEYYCFFVRDISVRREAEDRLRTGHTAIQNAANGIAVADLEGTINYVNSAMLDLWGLDDPNAMIGNNMRDFICDEETANTILMAMSRRLVWEQELACHTIGGNVFYVRASVAPNLNADDEVIGMVFSLLDITDVKLTALKLDDTLTELQRSNEDLEQFAYAVSHDLQAPLRKITAFAGIIKDGAELQLTPDMADALTRMQHSAGRMVQLIQGLLRYSRVSTRKQPYERLDLNDIVEDVLSDLEVSLLETGGTVNVAPLPEIAADPTQMRQLFQNLIGNALKFHKPGIAPTVDISGTLLPPSKENSVACCEIMVEDNGIGFPQEAAERIFGIFQMLNAPSDYLGTGIGLAICRKIVERHGGELTAVSEEGEGACFRAILPVGD
jgi:two-component system sensor kinase FixL